MTTFSSWLNTQVNRPDETGKLAREWVTIAHGRTSSLAGCSKLILEWSSMDPVNRGWAVPAVTSAQKEYREFRAPGSLADSYAVPQVLQELTSRLASVEEQLADLREHFGIPDRPRLAAVPDDQQLQPQPDAQAMPLSREEKIAEMAAANERGHEQVPWIEDSWAGMYARADFSAEAEAEAG